MEKKERVIILGGGPNRIGQGIDSVGEYFKENPHLVQEVRDKILNDDDEENTKDSKEVDNKDD